MPRRKLLAADLLCGAGGSSTGFVRAMHRLGFSESDWELVCVNHWKTAIDTHKANHPRARHYVQDIAAVRPHLLVPEGRLDLLLASPTCTHHSVARGGKPTSDQQRSDPWHILTWFTELRVKRAIIENVWEFIKWGPVDARTGKPIKSREGEYFRAWIDAIWKLGATSIEWRKLNAADYGGATTRSRFIMFIRFDGKPLSWPMPTHVKRAENELLFPGMQTWRPARDIIDWSIRGRSIYTRKKPLAAKTLARIHAGVVKFGWPEPFIVTLRNHMAAQSIDLPIPTVAARGTHIALAEPFIVRSNMHGRKSPGVRGAEDPLPTVTTDGGIAVIEPFIVSTAHGNDPRELSPNDRRVRSVDDPLGAIHAGGGNFAVAEPFMLSRQGEGAPRSVEEPTPTQVAKHSHLLIAPYYGSGSGETCNSGDELLPTVTTKGRFGMVMPVTHACDGQRARDIDIDPLPTITTAKRGELAFITAQHGERPGQTPRVHDIDNPAPTIAASGHVDLIQGTPEFDILFRMLEPHELAAAMGLGGYKFSGNKTEQIKQIGNAVSAEKMEACIVSMMADAVPKQKAAPVQRKRDAA